MPLITLNDTHTHSVRLLWTSDRSFAENYLSTHSTHNRQTSMPPAGFEPTISAGERPQTYVLDRAATGTGCADFTLSFYCCVWFPVAYPCKTYYFILHFKRTYVRRVSVNAVHTQLISQYHHCKQLAQ